MIETIYKMKAGMQNVDERGFEPTIGERERYLLKAAGFSDGQIDQCIRENENSGYGDESPARKLAKSVMNPHLNQKVRFTKVK